MSVTIIRDPVIEPFFVSKDQYSYTVFETVTPQEKYIEEGSAGKDYTRPIGHYSNFVNALEAIFKTKLNSKEGDYTSIKEYLEEWKNLKDEIKNLLEKIDI